MEKRRTIGITIFGILGIIWGVVIVFRITISLIKYHSAVSQFPSGFGFLSDKFTMIPSSLLLAYGIIFLVGGIGVLKLKPWGHRLFITIGLLFLLLAGINFILFGFFVEKQRLLSSIIFGGLILWFFNRDKVKRVFVLSENDLKKEKSTYFAAIIIAVLAVLGYFYFVNFNLKPANPLLFYNPKRIDYTFENKVRLLQDYKKRQFLTYDIYLPSNFRIRSFSYDDDFNWVDMVISNPDKTSFILFTNKPLFELMLPISKMLAINNSYEFGKRFVREKVSIIFLIWKNLGTSALGGFDEIYFGSWKGFLQRETRKGKEIYAYEIWHKGTGKSLGVTFIIKKQALTEVKIKDMISSIGLNSSKKTAEQYFKEGLNLFNQKKYEEAKFNFITALFQNRNNPQYSYYLGRAFFETQDWGEAKKHFQKTIALRPDYIEAQKLLDEIENKEPAKLNKNDF